MADQRKPLGKRRVRRPAAGVDAGVDARPT